MSGRPSPRESSSSGSAASFIKVVEQLIDSDDQQIRSKKMHELQNVFPVLKKISQNTSNSDKIMMFLRDSNFRHILGDKLLEKFGIEKIPTVKMQLYSIRYRSLIQEELDQADVAKIFERFGKISCLYVDKIFAYIQFQSFIASYLAIQTLNEFQIVSGVLRLSVRWSKPEQQLIAEQHFYAKFNAITKAFVNIPRSEKFNCKYSIHIPCPPEFKLVQKIIGPKGNNMKKIFEKISNQHKIASVRQAQKNLKMRLRGKGSGYHEGPNGQESQQLLNLCISSKQKCLYESACQEVQKLIQKLANDYKFEFERMFNRLLQGLVYKKIQLQENIHFQTKQFKLQQLPSYLCQIQNADRKSLTARQIQEQINLRNKARKMGKYRQGDQIRQRLKNKGIILTDGTGKRNTYTTTWNYIGE